MTQSFANCCGIRGKKRTHYVPLLEINQRFSGNSNSGLSHHPVDYFPITVHPQVFNSLVITVTTTIHTNEKTKNNIKTSDACIKKKKRLFLTLKKSI